MLLGIGSVIKQSIPEELEGDDITEDPNEVRAPCEVLYFLLRFLVSSLYRRSLTERYYV